MTQVYDLSDPAKPVNIRDFGLPGQQPGSTGTVPTDLHGPISTGPQGNRVYFAYGTNKGGVLQIVDREKLLNGPKEPTPENLRAPVIGQLDMLPLNGAHTAVPLGKMKIAEFAKDKAGDPRHRDDRRRVAGERVPGQRDAPDGVVRRRHDRVAADGGVELQRAGSEREFLRARRPLRRAFVEREHGAGLSTRRSRFITFFNAGVRAVDIRDPYQPKEIGYFIPAITERPTSAASRSTARTAARSRSRATTWRPTTAATSTWSIAPIPACTSSN